MSRVPPLQYRWLALRPLLVLGSLLAIRPLPLAQAATPSSPSAADAGAAEPRLDCLPQRSGDLVALVRATPFTSARDLTQPGPQAMVPITRGSPRWMSGFNAILAWENDDCPAFAAFAEHMGYDAYELTDTRSRSHHWVLSEKAGRKNGVFVLRAPGERDRARPLVISAPHRGLSPDLDGATQLYLATSAVALLQNSAHPCNLASCGGCMMGDSPLCGAAGCTRASDAAGSVDNLQFALFAALVATRRDLRLEYGALPTSLPASASAPPGCRGLARLSQGPAPAVASSPTLVIDAIAKSLQARLGASCVCYGEGSTSAACKLPPRDSLYGRLANEEPLRPFDPCGQSATQRSGRYVYVESRGLPLPSLATVINQALPLPSATAPAAAPAPPAGR